MSLQVFHGGPIFDGQALRENAFASFEDDLLLQVGDAAQMPQGGTRIDLAGDILSPGYVDLQVNGGGGVMLGNDPSVETLDSIARAHRSLGVTSLLPTLITDRRDTTLKAIDAAKAAIAAGVPGIVGLHLEGPHISVARKGAHDARLIRPMGEDDLQDLLGAARDLPCLMVTLAPENATEAQVHALAEVGAVVSLGHSDADFATCRRYFAAGARCATHLFNAMSQIGSRAPGLAGAALSQGGACAGLIADGIHVHPETVGLAWRAKRGPGRIFLVSDAMAVAGTDLREFELGGRRITRQKNELRLEDGTLAGADLALTRAVSVLVNQAGVPLGQALFAATTAPAQLAGLNGYGLRPGETTLGDTILIRADLSGLV